MNFVGSILKIPKIWFYVIFIFISESENLIKQRARDDIPDFYSSSNINSSQRAFGTGDVRNYSHSTHC